MYYLVKVTADNNVKLVTCEARSIPLQFLRNEVGGYTEVVRLPRIPDLAMVVNENGCLGFGHDHQGLTVNFVGSGLYANLNYAIRGDVVFGTFYNPDPFAEPDVYAFDSINALKVKSFLEELIEEYKKAELI